MRGLKAGGDRLAGRIDLYPHEVTAPTLIHQRLSQHPGEDRLFVKMNECGFPREYGPVGVMLAEHTAGRAHVRVLADIAGQSGPLSAGEREQLREHAREFVPLLLGHIQKEDNILYPMAQQAIPPLAFTKLDADCEAFEQQVMPPGDKQRLEDLAAELISAYPPDPARLAAAMSCTGCPGHA